MGAAGHGAAQVPGGVDPEVPASGNPRLLRHTREVVRAAVTQQGTDLGDVPADVLELHDRTFRLLHHLSLECGLDAVAVGAEYAVAALGSGALSVRGGELDDFLVRVVPGIRETSRDLARGTPFGS